MQKFPVETNVEVDNNDPIIPIPIYPGKETENLKLLIQKIIAEEEYTEDSLENIDNCYRTFELAKDYLINQDITPLYAFIINKFLNYVSINEAFSLDDTNAIIRFFSFMFDKDYFKTLNDETKKAFHEMRLNFDMKLEEIYCQNEEYSQYINSITLDNLNKLFDYAFCQTDVETINNFYVLAALKIYQIYFAGINFALTDENEKMLLDLSVSKIYDFLVKNSDNQCIYRLFIKLNERDIFNDFERPVLNQSTANINEKLKELCDIDNLRISFYENYYRLQASSFKLDFIRNFDNFQTLNICMLKLLNTKMIADVEFEEIIDFYLLAAETYIVRLNIISSMAWFAELFKIFELILDQYPDSKLEQNFILGGQLLTVMYMAINSLLEFDFNLGKTQELIIKLSDKIISFEKTLINSFVALKKDQNLFCESEEMQCYKLLSLHNRCYEFRHVLGRNKFFNEQINLIFKYLEIVYYPNRLVKSEFIHDLITSVKTHLVHQNLYKKDKSWQFHKSITDAVIDTENLAAIEKYNLDLVSCLCEHYEAQEPSYYAGISDKIQLLFDTTDENFFSLDDFCFFLKVKRNSIEKSKPSSGCIETLKSLYDDAYKIIDLIDIKFGLSQFLPNSILKAMKNILEGLQTIYKDDAVKVKKYREKEFTCVSLLITDSKDVHQLYEYGLLCYRFYCDLIKENDIERANYYHQEALNMFIDVTYLLKNDDPMLHVFKLLAAKIYLQRNEQEKAFKIVYEVINIIKKHKEYTIDVISCLRSFLNLFLDQKIAAVMLSETEQDLTEIVKLWKEMLQIKWQSSINSSNQTKKHNNQKSSLATLKLSSRMLIFLKISQIIAADDMFESTAIFTCQIYFKFCELKFKTVKFLWESKNFNKIFETYQFAIQTFDFFLQDKAMNEYHELFNLIDIDLRKIILDKNIGKYSKLEETLTTDYWKICVNEKIPSHYFVLLTEIIQQHFTNSEQEKACDAFIEVLKIFGKMLVEKNYLSIKLLDSVLEFFKTATQNDNFNKKYLQQAKMEDCFDLINKLITANSDKTDEFITMLYRQICNIQQSIILVDLENFSSKTKKTRPQASTNANASKEQSKESLQNTKNNLAGINPKEKKENIKNNSVVVESKEQAKNTKNNSTITEGQIQNTRNKSAAIKSKGRPKNTASNNTANSKSKQKPANANNNKNPNKNSVEAKNQIDKSLPKGKSTINENSKSTVVEDNSKSVPETSIIEIKEILTSNPVLVPETISQQQDDTQLKKLIMSELLNEEFPAEKLSQLDGIKLVQETTVSEKPSQLDGTKLVQEITILNKTSQFKGRIDNATATQPHKWLLFELLQNEALHKDFSQKISALIIEVPKLVFMRLYRYAGRYQLSHKKSKIYAFDEMCRIFEKAIMHLLDLKESKDEQINKICMKFFNDSCYDDFNYRSTVVLFEGIKEEECKFKDVLDHIQGLKLLIDNPQISLTPNLCKESTAIEPPPKYLEGTKNQYEAPIPIQLNVDNKNIPSNGSKIINKNSPKYNLQVRNSTTFNYVKNDSGKTPVSSIQMHPK